MGEQKSLGSQTNRTLSYMIFISCKTNMFMYLSIQHEQDANLDEKIHHNDITSRQLIHAGCTTFGKLLESQHLRVASEERGFHT
jgi:hypothetical protein